MIKSNLIREAGKYVLSSVLAIGLSYSIADAGKYPKGTQHYLDNVKIIGIDGFEKIFKNEVFVDGRFINYGNNTIAGMISGIKGNEQTRLEDILNKFEGKIQSIKYNGITYNQENFDNFYSILKKKKEN